VEGDRDQKEKTARGTSAHAPQHRYSGALAIGNPACPGPAEESGNVLNADDQARQHRAESHAQMNIGGKNGQGKADGEIADQREIGERQDLTYIGGRCCQGRRRKTPRRRTVRSFLKAKGI
jgi:hypothetical protein